MTKEKDPVVDAVPAIPHVSERVRALHAQMTLEEKLAQLVGYWLDQNGTVAPMQSEMAAGQKAFAACSICHRVGEGAENVVGPELNGVVGRKAGSVQNFAYSQAMKASGLVWTEALIGVAYASVAYALLRLFEFDGRRRASLETM